MVRLNRAVAAAMAVSPADGLALVDDPGLARELEGYHLYAATRADLLRRSGRVGEVRPPPTGWPEPDQQPRPSTSSSTGGLRQLEEPLPPAHRADPGGPGRRSVGVRTGGRRAEAGRPGRAARVVFG